MRILAVLVLLFVAFLGFNACQARMENVKYQDQARRISEQRSATPVTWDEDPFTLNCAVESEESYVNFDITIDPRQGRSYVWEITGVSKKEGAKTYSTSGAFLGMEHEIYPITKISDDEIVTGSLDFDRKNGKVAIGYFFGDGPCTLANIKPIDGVKF